MTGLPGFLLARIAEDEAAAQAGAGEPVYEHYADSAAGECIVMADNEGCAETGTAHLSRWLPDRVLAECKAKVLVIKAHPIVGGWEDEDMNDHGDGCETCGHSEHYSDTGGACETLRLLALPYADHPDYREEWKP